MKPIVNSRYAQKLINKVKGNKKHEIKIDVTFTEYTSQPLYGELDKYMPPRPGEVKEPIGGDRVLKTIFGNG